MRFDENYIYPDDKGNLHSPKEKGTHRTLLPYEVELLKRVAKFIKALKSLAPNDWDLFLECDKDDFISFRTAKRLGISRHKIDNLIKRVSQAGQSKSR